MNTSRRPSSHNRFVIYKNKKMTVAEACRKSGLNSNTVRSRLHAGWSGKAAFELETHLGGGWVKGRKRSEANRVKCRASQRRRRARGREQRQREQDAAYEQFLNHIPIRSEPILMTRLFQNKETEPA